MTRLRTHPGEVLAEEYMKPLGLSAAALARDLGVAERLLDDFLAGRRGVDAAMAADLGRRFGVEPRFWLDLQKHFDRSRAEDRDA